MNAPTENRSGFRFFLLFLIVATGPMIGIFVSDCAAQAPVIKNIRVVPPEKTGMTNHDMQNICAAAISTLFDRPTSSIAVESIEKGMMHLSMPPADGVLRQYKCRIEGKNVYLAAKDDSRQADDSRQQVTFQLSDHEILIVAGFPDGSEKRGRFPRE